MDDVIDIMQDAEVRPAIWELKSNNALTVRCYPLGEDFYSKVRNDLSYDKLKTIAQLSRRMPEPEVFGKFISEEHYQSTVNLYISSTLETRHRCHFFLRYILPQLNHRESMLDVGPGSGRLTKCIGKNFRKITLVDPYIGALDSLGDYFLKKNLLVEKINGRVEGLSWQGFNYDLCVVSHVLYHVNVEKWVNVVSSLYSGLNNGGLMVIVLNSDLDRSSLVEYFGGRSLNVNCFVGLLLRVLDVQAVYASEEVFHAIDIHAMLHIAGLHLADNGITAPKEALQKYINDNYSDRFNKYSMKMCQHFIIIRKEL